LPRTQPSSLLELTSPQLSLGERRGATGGFLSSANASDESAPVTASENASDESAPVEASANASDESAPVEASADASDESAPVTASANASDESAPVTASANASDESAPVTASANNAVNTNDGVVALSKHHTIKCYREGGCRAPRILNAYESE
jgi:hypothetical protein